MDGAGPPAPGSAGDALGRLRHRRLIAVACVVVVLVGVVAAVTWASSGRADHRSAPRATVTTAETLPAAPRTTMPSLDGTTFTLVGTGDLLTHLPVDAQAQAYGRSSGQPYDFRPMLAKIKPEIAAADLAICHVETPISADNTRITGYPVFNSPRELADAMADLGCDGASTASNHTVDKGLAGVVATLDNLDRVGIAHAGSARSPVEASRPEVHRVKGVSVAHLSYAYGTNGVPVSQPWEANFIDVPQILIDAHRARVSGAQLVVVSMHWGQEYQTAPSSEQQQQAAALLASPDVDLILGDHVHVVQPVEKINGKFVIFGMGNLVSNQSPAAGLRASTQDGAVFTAHVRVEGTRPVVQSVTYTPTFVQIPSYVVTPVVSALNDPATPATLRSLLTASLQRTETAVSSTPGHERDATRN